MNALLIIWETWFLGLGRKLTGNEAPVLRTDFNEIFYFN